MPDRITLSSPGDVVACVPAMLGFHPRDSLVLLWLSSKTGTLVCTLRLDLGTAPAEVTRRLAGLAARLGPGRLLTAVYPKSLQAWVDSTTEQQLLTALGEAKTAGVSLLDTLLVADGRWWSLICTDPGCCPTAGSPVSEATTALEALSVVIGHPAVAPSREAVLSRYDLREPLGLSLVVDAQAVLGDAMANPHRTGVDGDRGRLHSRGPQVATPRGKKVEHVAGSHRPILWRLFRESTLCETRDVSVTGVSAGQSLTGERTLPGIWHENYWFRRHEVVYAFLDSRIPARARVLDAGCGEGYGSALLAAGGQRSVVGLDYDARTLGDLAEAYPTVAALRANLVSLPFDDATFDGVISLQVVEHIWEQPRYVAECARVLRPGGVLALSTPNRLTFSPSVGRGEKPLNPFHVNEFDPPELVDLVGGAGLEDVGLLGLRHGDQITDWEREHGSVVAAQLAEPYDRWQDHLVELVRSVTIDDFAVSADDVDSSLDLLVLARRPEGLA